MRRDLRDISLQQMQRFGVISEYKARRLRGQSVAEIVREMASLGHFDPDTGEKIRFSERTIYRWIARFEKWQIEGLKNAARKRKPEVGALSLEFLEFLQWKKKEDPTLSVPELIRQARLQGIIGENRKICRSTVYRALLRMGVPVEKIHSVRTNDMRRFRYPHRMQLLMGDGKFFNVGSSSIQRLAIFFIDDATSYVHPRAVVGMSENTELFMRALDGIFRDIGLSDMLYLDRGPAFIANDTAKVLAKLGVQLILGRAGYPPARGKIERFNRTIKEQLLMFLDRRVDVDPSPHALENLINHYLRETYNKASHEGLGGKTPEECFFAEDQRPLRLIKNQSTSRAAFLIPESRRVATDNVVSVGGHLYEMPLGYAGRKVTLNRSAFDQRILFDHRGEILRLSVVDPEKNALSGRTSRRASFFSDSHTLPRSQSAAEMKFRKSHAVMTDDDGNFFNTIEDGGELL